VSVFHPDRLSLVKGAPAHRRAHLDRLCGAIWPARSDLRSRFGRTLAQRNALVARVKAGLGGADSLPSWDERLAAEAEPLVAARAEAVEALSAPFAELAEGLGLPPGDISYRPRAEGNRDELAAELARRREQDLGRAYTSYGPQLDEVELRLDGHPLRRFGSQGQQRLALLALLFAERQVLLDAGRSAPLMLLDDVMSELDPDHRRLLVELLERGGGQALLTATEADHVPSAAAVCLSVSDGTVTSKPVLRAA
jgi:DNA replication and repair protein RecF